MVDGQHSQAMHGGPEDVRGQDLILRTFGRDGKNSGSGSALNDLFQPPLWPGRQPI